ncbi:MAG: PorV/PorQ family protein [Bacteroidetes bacterium]|nr:PorV/PorQ family protein [Bacteroidota bacterium]
MSQRILTIVVLITISLSAVKGQDATGREESLNALRYTVPFLTISPDSRAGALGDAGVATSPDINSQHWNAAKYPFMKERAGIAITYTPWLRGLGVTDLNLVNAAGYMKFDDNQAVSGSMQIF